MRGMISLRGSQPRKAKSRREGGRVVQGLTIKRKSAMMISKVSSYLRDKRQRVQEGKRVKPPTRSSQRMHLQRKTRKRRRTRKAARSKDPKRFNQVINHKL